MCNCFKLVILHKKRNIVATVLIRCESVRFLPLGYFQTCSLGGKHRTQERFEERISDKYAGISLSTSQKISASFILRLQHVISADVGSFENTALLISCIKIFQICA